MSDTIRVEMDMPRPPEGWRLTGEYRVPNIGERFLNNDGQAGLAGSMISKFPILERVQWEPKTGELVFFWNPSHGIISYFFDGHGDTLLFRSEADAAKFGQQVLALADRIRAESEVG
jgi:hypothetical protein